MKLYKGNTEVLGRTSKRSRYDAELASMDSLGSYNQSHAEGFVRTQALGLTDRYAR